MALAGVVAASCAGFPSVLLTLSNALAIAPRLIASNLLPGFSRAIPTSRSPTRPAAGSLPTRFTAIAAQCVDRNETAFTILQQTQSSARTANAGTLNRARSEIMMLRAHGSDCSPTVKSRSGAVNFAPRRFAKRRANARADRPASLPSMQISRIEKTATRTQRCDQQSANRLPWSPHAGSHFPRHSQRGQESRRSGVLDT